MIFLIGYRGCGKSTVGRELAARLGWTFLDADSVLEAVADKSITTIFATEGETAFRDLESTVLRDLATKPKHVIATGGGVVLRAENRERLMASGFVAWLDATPELVWPRIQTDPRHHLGGFGAHVLANVGHLVGEPDFHGEERIGGVLDHLRAGQRCGE